MQKLKKLCLLLAAILTISVPLSSCAYENAEESSLYSESSPIEDSSSAPNTSEKEDEDFAQKQAEMWAIVDALYELSPGETLPESSYTLTGIVISKEYVNRKRSFTIAVIGREDKPVYCYNIQGANASLVETGDTITVSGSLKNYKGTYFEFDSACTLDAWISADGDNDGGNHTDNNDTTEQPYTPAQSNQEAKERTAKYMLSGSITVPDQAPTLASNRPKSGEKFIRNREMQYSENDNAYTVVDASGNDAFTVYRDGAYITLEEVAAFVYAFGTYPANYVADKDTTPHESGWGEYLRLNHTKFSGDTKNYPYEPKLPNISGCGGNLQYYEMDIGTTGTDCDPKRDSVLYNNGKSITRGAARIVYGKKDLNNNGVLEENEFHLFYTYNHYNDFQEYLNYQGGWGEMFGNITGGGTLSSKTHYAPTDYVSVAFTTLPSLLALATTPIDQCSIL